MNLTSSTDKFPPAQSGKEVQNQKDLHAEGRKVLKWRENAEPIR